MDNIKDFLKACMGTQSIHYTHGKDFISPQNILGTDDVYFCGGMRKDYISKDGERPKKGDYISKSYFYIDIDVRKTYLSINGVLLQGKEFIDECNNVISTVCLYSDPNAIVCSGNGLHIYYIGEEKEIDDKTYSIGVSEFIKNIDKHLGIYSCDTVSKAKSAISRLPGTFNKFSSESKYGIDKQPVTLLLYTQGESKDWKDLQLNAEKYINEIKSKPNDFLVSHGGGDTIFDAINNVNVADLFSSNTGIELAGDGKNFISPKDGGYIGCFYSKEDNILLNIGTSYITSGDSGYSSYTYVKKEILGGQDTKYVIDWFCDRFNHIADIRTKEKLLYLEGKKVIGEKEIDTQKRESKSRDPSEYKGEYFSWGNKVLDNIIGFNEEHDLIILHGKYGCGKTTLGTSMCNFNGEKGIKSCLMTLEMNADKLKKAQAVGRCGISKPDLQAGKFSEEDRLKMIQYYNDYDKNFLLVGDGQSVDISDLCKSIKELYNQGYKLFVIDNLRKINVVGAKTDNQVDIIKMQALQSLKNELPICIVLIHHDNKEGSGFSGTQVIGDLADTIVHVTKELDPDADGKKIFHQAIIDIYKERLNQVRECIFNFNKGALEYVDSYIKEGKKK